LGIAGGLIGLAIAEGGAGNLNLAGPLGILNDVLCLTLVLTFFISYAPPAMAPVALNSLLITILASLIGTILLYIVMLLHSFRREVRQDFNRLSDKIDGIGQRLTYLEGRFDEHFGPSRRAQ
jgi:hypothetical protein